MQTDPLKICQDLDQLIKQLEICSNLCDDIAIIALPTDGLLVPEEPHLQTSNSDSADKAHMWTLKAKAVFDGYKSNYEMVIDLVELQNLISEFKKKAEFHKKRISDR